MSAANWGSPWYKTGQIAPSPEAGKKGTEGFALFTTRLAAHTGPRWARPPGPWRYVQ